MEYDVVVIGGGPAGLSAATWLGRYRRSTLVVDAGEQRNRWADLGHGWLGADPTQPAAVLDRARSDLARYETITLRKGRVTSARRERPGRFLVWVDGEDEPCVGQRVILCTGVADAFPEVDGFFEHYGADVFHCPSCDGYEARDRRVVVLGWSAHVAGFALTLLDWAGELTVVTEGRPFEGDDVHRDALARHGVELVEDDAVALLGGRGELCGMRLASGRVLECDMAFFSIEHRSRTDLAEQLGVEVTEEGCLLVDRDGMTGVEGVYAAGDITPGFQLAIVAAGKGAAAGVACATSLRGEAGAPTSPEPAPDPEAELSR